jgi:hypothetical protein
MAVVFEGIEVKSDGRLVLDEPARDRMVQVKMELKENKAMSLPDVVGEKAKPFSRRAYAYAGLFVWWLTKGGRQQRRVLDDLLTSLSTRGYREKDLENLLQSRLGKSLEAVEREWRTWVRKQKVEYTGQKAPGGAYSSKLLGFKMKRPKSDWVMDGDKAPVDGECIVYKRPRTGARIGVTAYVNQLPLYAGELYLQWLRDLQDNVNGLAIEQKERIQFKGHPGFRITYTGSEPGSNITKEKQKVQLSVIVTGHHIYVLRAQSPPEKWRDNDDDFSRAFESFKLLK